MLKNKIFYVLVLLIPLFVGCGGSDPVQPPAEAPRVMNFKADPNVICVGAASNITFDLVDPNQDPINWTLKLSSTIHGALDKTSGTDASGSHLSVRFKAATSGRHRHRISATVSATDPGGLPAQDVSIDLYVFNCG
jgi:PBP1b-binding outer membrane lipoprotein LpoB